MKLLTRTCVGLYCLLGLQLTAYALDPVMVVQKADLMRFPKEDASFKVTITDYERDQQVRTTTYKVSARNVGPSNDSLVETTSPERMVGRKLLMKGDDLWLYTPDTRKPVRISLQQKLTGEVSNGDLSRTNFASDYAPSLLGAEVIKGQKTLKLELKAKSKTATYPKIHFWVSEKAYVPLKAIYFALSGKPLKTGVFSDIKKFAPGPLVTKCVVTDALNPKKRSEIVYENFHSEKFDESLFNKQSLTE